MFKTGQITHYSAEDGIGFICPEQSDKAIYFHIADFPTGSKPKIGEKVSFIVEKQGDIYAAKNILYINSENLKNAKFNNWQIQGSLRQRQPFDHTKPYDNKPVKSLSRSNDATIKHATANDHFLLKLIVLLLCVVAVFVSARLGFNYFNLQQNSSDASQSAVKPSNENKQAAFYAAIQAPPHITKPPKSEVNGNVILPTLNASNSIYRCDGRTQCAQMHSHEEALWFMQNCRNNQIDRNGDGLPCN